MKQPKNRLLAHIFADIRHGWCVEVFEEDDWIRIAEGRTKQSALKAGIKRAEKLKRDMERMLEMANKC